MPTRGQTVAEGAYTTLRNDETVGHETWLLSKMAHSGLLFTSHEEETGSQPMSWNLSYQLTQHWVPTNLTVRTEKANQTLSSEQQIEGARYVARIESHGAEPREVTLEWNGKSQVDFPSPIFAAVTLIRLNLQVGQSQTVDAVLVTPQSLEPRRAKQVYTCVAEEKVEVPAGAFSAWHYTVRTGDEANAPAEGPEVHFWADRHGIVLLQQEQDGREVKLTRYRRTDRR